jgi:OFA family oxalate/formate antiporter-like MFS transporter
MLAVLGGFLTHLTYGTMYCWGNFQSYLPPSMKYYDPAQTTGSPDAMMVIPLTIIFQCIGMPLSQHVQKLLGLPLAMFLGASLVSGGVYLSSHATTLKAFVLAYCVMFGLGNGLGYTSPIIASFKHYPNRKGLVSGIIVGGFGSGGFLFNYIGSKLFNPNNLATDPKTGLFPKEVYDNFGPALTKLAKIYFCMQLVGAIMLRASVKSLPADAPTATTTTTTVSKPPSTAKYPTVTSAVFSRPFLVLWVCIVLSATAGLNTVSLYKMYGSKFPAIKSDSFLSLVGGLGSLANGLGRTQWGLFLDVYGFKKLFSFLTVLQAGIMLAYKHTVGSKMLFQGATMLIFLCLGGNFAMAPGVTAAIFGADLGPKVFALLFSSFAVAAIFGAKVNKALLVAHGFDSIFKVMAISSLTAGLTANTLLEGC